MTDKDDKDKSVVIRISASPEDSSKDEISVFDKFLNRIAPIYNASSKMAEIVAKARATKEAAEAEKAVQESISLTLDNEQKKMDLIERKLKLANELLPEGVVIDAEDGFEILKGDETAVEHQMERTLQKIRNLQDKGTLVSIKRVNRQKTIAREVNDDTQDQ